MPQFKQESASQFMIHLSLSISVFHLLHQEENNVDIPPIKTFRNLRNIILMFNFATNFNEILPYIYM